MVLAAAMLACWGHLLVSGTMRHVLGSFSWKWWLRDQVLLSSLGYTIVFAALSFVPLVLHVAWPRRVTLARLATFEVALAAFAILLLLQRIAPWALLVIALAVAVRFHAWAAGHVRELRVAARRIAAIGSAASLLVATGTIALRSLRERSAVRQLAAAPAGTPNVLLLILDTVRARSMGLYGGAVSNTPALGAWAERGVLFESAYSTASWTLPSHASMFTGAYASRSGADWRAPLGTERATLAEVLGEHGLVAGGFVANTVAAWYRTGLARGFTRYEDAPLTLDEVLLSTTFTQSTSVVNAYIEWNASRWPRAALQALAPLSLRPHGNYLWNDDIPAHAVAERFLDWERGLAGRPFFAFLNFFDAHAPYLPPPRYRSLYGTGGRAIDRYLGAIRYMDDEIDALLRELDRRGRLRNTIVIVTSDHGESFGEHDLVGHGNGLYRNQIRVPLLILNGPGLPAGRRVAVPVSLRDLAATIADLAGITRHPFGGTSLRRLIVNGERDGLSPAIAEVSRSINVNPGSFVGRADQKSFIDDSVHVVGSSLGTLAAFDIREDSLEEDDLCDGGDPCAAARALLARVLEAHRIVW